MKADIIGSFLTTTANGVPFILPSKAHEVPCCFFQDEFSVKSSNWRLDNSKFKITRLQTYFRKSLLASVGKLVNEDAELQIIEMKTTQLNPQNFVRNLEKKYNLNFSSAMEALLKNYEVGRLHCNFCQEKPDLAKIDVLLHGYLLKKGIFSNDLNPLLITMTLDEFRRLGSIFLIFYSEDVGQKIICTTFNLDEHSICSSVIRRHLPPLMESGPENFKKFNHLLNAEDSSERS
eukprot:GHVP01042584.1.p1 GENE.GHVP01042584.1~~GHVP01042584.1.p1  ORF type:complete len:242 (+),score=29.94 GHVP01042584.1:30-728(+)